MAINFLNPNGTGRGPTPACEAVATEIVGRVGCLDKEADAAGGITSRICIDDLENSLRVANDRLNATGVEAAFTYNAALGQAVLTVTDKNTNRIILQIPSEASQRLQAQIDQLAGLIVDLYS